MSASFFEHGRKRFFALFQIDAHQVVTVGIEQIEGVVDDRDGMIGCGATCADPSGALLHQAERGTAFVVQCGNFAVDDGALAAKVVGKRLQLRELSRQLVPIARDEAYRAILDVSNCAIAVPLDFEEPVFVIEWLLNECGEHGMNYARNFGALRAL